MLADLGGLTGLAGLAGLACLAALTGAMVGAAPALASTMPAADFQSGSRTVGLGIGFGGGLSFDAALTPNLSAGLSASWLASPPTGERYDLHLLYQFINGGTTGLSVSGIVGLWADTSLPGGPFPYMPPFEGGFGIAYPFTPELVGRLNLVVPLFNPTRSFDIFGGPAAGLEVAYRFQPNLEATLGLNGQGNLLGARLTF